MKNDYVVLQNLWVQVSADYQAEKRSRVLIVSPTTTVEEIIKWSKTGDALGRGDVVLIEQG